MASAKGFDQFNTLTNSITPNTRVEIQSIPFLEAINLPDQKVSQLILEHKTILSSIAVSIGLVTWATQLGALFASVLAAVPAWKNLDPIAILGKDEDDDTVWNALDEDAEENEAAATDVLSSVESRV